jgi:hypothetical protein
MTERRDENVTHAVVPALHHHVVALGASGRSANVKVDRPLIVAERSSRFVESAMLGDLSIGVSPPTTNWLVSDGLSRGPSRLVWIVAPLLLIVLYGHLKSKDCSLSL